MATTTWTSHINHEIMDICCVMLCHVCKGIHHHTKGIHHKYRAIRYISTNCHHILSHISQSHVSLKTILIPLREKYPNKNWKKLILINVLHAKCRFICIRELFSLREVHIYMHGGYSSKAKRDLGVNPCLLSSNKSRPHLSTYIVISEGQEGEIQLRERRWILPRVSKHKAFPRTWEANGLQTSHKAEALP